MCRPRHRSKTEGDTVADVQAYIDINTLNEVKAKALVYTQAYKFPKCRPKVLLTH